MLQGSLVATEPIECTVPSETMLLVQVVGVECSTLEPPPFYGGNEAELRACARSFHFTNLHATLDGVAIGNGDRYLVESPLFSFTVPEDSIFGIPNGATGQAVSYRILSTSVVVMLIAAKQRKTSRFSGISRRLFAPLSMTAHGFADVDRTLQYPMASF